MKCYRQGDVFIEAVSAIPTGGKRIEGRRIVLADGEVTGHQHAITADPASIEAHEKDGKIYLHISDPVDLVHEEHGKIPLPPGDYVSYIQREYDPLGTRRVED